MHPLPKVSSAGIYRLVDTAMPSCKKSFFGVRVSQCSPDWSTTHYEHQVCLKLKKPYASISQVWGIKGVYYYTQLR